MQAEKLRGLAKFGSVDCSEGANKAFCSAAGLRSLPAVKLYGWEARTNPYKPRDGLVKFPDDYAGELAARPLSEAVTAVLPHEFVLNVSSSQPDWRAQLSGGLPLAVLFTERAGATPLYRALSLRFRQRMRLALARADDAALASAFGVTTAPALVLQLSSGELVRYDGELKAAALAEFLEQHAAPPPAEEKPREPEKPAEAPAWQPLALHNASHLASAILSSEQAALVAFVGGQACTSEREAWRTAARPLDGQVSVAEADADAPWAARYAAAGRCLTIVRFAFGADKADADADTETYPADVPLQKGALGAWALETVPDFVQFVTANTAQPYFSAEPRLPKLLLVSDKAETPAMFRALAANFHGRVQFARTHVKEELAASMGVKRAPAVKALLVPPDAKPNPDGTLPLALQDYYGPLSYDHLSMFCEAMAAHTAQSGADGGEGAAAAKGTDVVELSDSAALHSTCEARGGLCLVALLDSRSTALQAQLAQMRAAASRQRAAAPVHFCWVDMARHAAFAAAFDVATAPSAVVLSAKKLRYAPLRIAFSTDAVASLIDDVLAGRVSTVALSALPGLEAGAPGSTAPLEEEPAEVEEEFDLSDIMGVEVDDSSSREARLREAEQALKREAEERAAAAQEEAARAKPKKKKRKANKKQEL